MNNNLDDVSALASRYVNERDNFAKRYHGPKVGTFGQNISPGGPMAFSSLVTAHAVSLAAILPPLTLAQWEGLSELTSAYLAHLRMTYHTKDVTP